MKEPCSGLPAPATTAPLAIAPAAAAIFTAVEISNGIKEIRGGDSHPFSPGGSSQTQASGIRSTVLSASSRTTSTTREGGAASILTTPAPRISNNPCKDGGAAANSRPASTNKAV